MTISLTKPDLPDTDLPAGYRWATADETEAWGGILPVEAKLVPRTVDSKGVRYCQSEADVAVLEGYGDIGLDLEITNVYEDATVISRIEIAVPTPPGGQLDKDHADYEDWEMDYIFPHTGTGKEDGDAAYFVLVLSSAQPNVIPIGAEFEFGL